MVNTAPGFGGGGGGDDGGSSDPSAPPDDSTGGTVSPGDEVEDAAEEYDDPNTGGRPDAGDTRPRSTRVSAGTTDPTGTIDDGGGGVTDRISSGIDAVTSGVGGAVSDVQSGVNRVSDTLPGPTGKAFTAGVALAAVPEPTPVTETSGAAIAGGAALVGGGVLASRALRRRAGEVGVGERVRNELEVGQSRQDVSEVGAGATQTTTEIEPGATGPSTTEVGLGSTTAGSEIDVGTGGDTGAGPTINVAQQLGIGEQSGQQIGQEEETFTIGRDTIEDVERTGDLEEAERQRQIREELERRQEFVREDGNTGQIQRDPVRFPADEAATGTAPGILEQVGSDFSPGEGEALGTAVGAGATTPDFLAGDRVSDDVTGVGTDPTSGTGLKDPLASQTGAGTLGETGPTTTTETGGVTDSATDTGTDSGTDVLTDTTTVQASATAQPQAQAVTEATPQQFAQPEVTTFETQVSEPTQPGTSTGQGSRRRPRRDEPDLETDDDPFSATFGIDEDEFGSGILSGQQAAAETFEDLGF